MTSTVPQSLMTCGRFTNEPCLLFTIYFLLVLTYLHRYVVVTVGNGIGRIFAMSDRRHRLRLTVLSVTAKRGTL